MTVKELKSFAKGKGLKVYFKYSKSKIIKFLKEYEKYESDFEEDLIDLKDIPKKFRTSKMYRVTYENEEIDKEDIPENMLTLEAFKNTYGEEDDSLDYYPPGLLNQEICNFAIGKNGLELKKAGP